MSQTTTSASQQPTGLQALWHLAFRIMDGLSGACLGFLFYGSWAVYANWSHGQLIAIRSGLAQGVMSFVVTLGGVLLMRALFRVPGPLWWRTACAALGSLGLIYAGILGVHWALQTPEILLTLLPGIPVTIAFCLVFSTSLARFNETDALTAAASPLE